MPQEKLGSDWMEMAKYHAKAEKETVEPYVIVTIEDRTTKEQLYQYDVPRAMFWRYDWVFRWRKSRYHCQRPKNDIVQTVCFYDKKTGLQYGLGSLLSGLVAAKANMTKLVNKREAYIEYRSQELFFNPETDTILAKFYNKIEQQKTKIAEYEQQIREKVNHFDFLTE